MATRRWLPSTAVFAATPVTPRRTEAGRFGMARTKAEARGARAARSAMVLPARIERTSVPGPASAPIIGAAASSICGLTPSTSTSGSAMAAWSGFSRKPWRAASAFSASLAFGSTTVTPAPSSPPPSQPSSMAPPILPAPISTSVRGKSPVIAFLPGPPAWLRGMAARKGQASPAVSIIAMSSASRAVRPAHSTNWKA